MSQQFQYLLLPKVTEKQSSWQSTDTKVLSNVTHRCQNEEVTQISRHQWMGRNRAMENYVGREGVYDW